MYAYRKAARPAAKAGIVLFVVAVILAITAVSAWSHVPESDIAAQAATAETPTPAEVRAAAGVPEPDAPVDSSLLPDGWHSSTDVAYDTSAGLGTYSVAVAKESERWEWRPLATIRPVGMEDAQLSGYHCVTGDGRWIVVVLVPRDALNVAWVRDRGGFAYKVSTTTGEVTPLRAGVAVKYHTPGCGAGEEVALLSHLGVDQERTRVEVVDLRGDETRLRILRDGQLTNAVPVDGRVVAARDKAVVSLHDDRETVLAETPGRPFSLKAAGSSVALLVSDHTKSEVELWATDGDSLARVGVGPLATTRLEAGAGGRAMAIGPEVRLDRESRAISVVGAGPDSSSRLEDASREGRLLLVNPSPAQTQAALGATGGDAQVGRLAVRPDTDRTLALVQTGPRDNVPLAAGPPTPLPSIDPSDSEELAPSEPAGLAGPGPDVGETISVDEPTGDSPEVLGEDGAAEVRPSSSGTASAGSIENALFVPGTSAELTEVQWTTPKCAVPRNALNRQVHQPNAAQVNWVIQQATRNNLKGTVLTRPAGFANLGLVAYQPSNDFTRHTLSGEPSSTPVPPSVIQGTFAQESNWKQASPRSLPGVAGNPNIGDYYGAGGTLNVIDYNDADCGYGISQVTDPMTAASGLYSANGKTKVAVDYAENVPAGLQFIVDKWNQLAGKSILFNGGDPDYLENWWGALWAYNSGYNAPDGSGAEGLGWTNNPMNADYPANRSPFLRTTYADAAHPSDWSYPERVAGWMETPQLDYEGQSQYAAPVYGSVTDLSVPTLSTFCTSHNSCDTSYLNGSLSYCTRSDRHCWWHTSVSWTSCPSICATSQFTVASNATEPAGDDNYPPNCNTVPASADPPRAVIVVDDQPNNLNIEGCTQSGWTNGGTFTVSYGTDGGGAPLGQIDWHQLGTGFGGHTWFTKNRLASDPPRINTGTWTPTSISAGLYTVQVHIPPSGASTPSAKYRVHLGNGSHVDREIDQHLHENRWVPLGSFNLQSGARVELTNVTSEAANYTTNVAFDAVAFVPARGTPQTATSEAVAVFDKDQNLDTGNPWFVDSRLASEASILAWADELIDGTSSTDGVLDYAACGGTPSSSCVGSNLRAAVSQWKLDVANLTIPEWLGYPNEDPAMVPGPGYFDDPTKHKQLNRLTLDYLVDGGQIVEGSITVTATHLTGTGHMPPFMLPVMQSIEDDYGIPVPDFEYTVANLGTYSHSVSTHDPGATGVVPGKAYRPYVTEPDYDGACAAIASVDGGSHPWKAFLNEGHVAGGVEAWKESVEDAVSNGVAPIAVSALADSIYLEYFSNVYNLGGYRGSVFRKAPPIWVEQNIRVCADGTVESFLGPQFKMAVSSYMPDVYLYVNGSAVDEVGAPQSFSSPTDPAVPVETGLFSEFANADAPLYLGTDQPYGWCGDTPGVPRHGNPWGISSLTGDEAQGDDVSLCSSLFINIHGP
jgi:hypothetical protein